MNRTSEFAIFHLMCKWNGLEKQKECPHFNALRGGCEHSPKGTEQSVALCYSGDANRVARAALGITEQCTEIGDSGELFPPVVTPVLEVDK